MSTVTVTNMPFWAERVGAPRTLAVEFPFGHILGRAHDQALQRKVIDQALELLEGPARPGATVHFQEPWPEPLEAGRRASHPPEPPPIAAEMGRHIGRLLMGLRRGGGGD
jgi:hypothetical protein